MRNVPGSWLDARPTVRTAWLCTRNVMRRWPLASVATVAAWAALALLGRLKTVAELIAAAARHPFFVLAAATLLAMIIVQRRRRRIAREAQRYWLAALPSDLPPTARATMGWLAGAAVVALWLVLTAEVARLPGRIPAVLIAFAAVGGVFGFALGWALSALTTLRMRHRRTGARARSRYSLSGRSRPGWATRAALTPLGGWPLAEARFRDRPNVRARSLGLLLLAVPLGTPVGRILTGVFAWLLLLHLINLMIAVLRAALPASWWLAPTPLGSTRFAVVLCHRAVAEMVIVWALLLGLTAAAFGSTAARTGTVIAVLWIGAACVLGLSASVLAMRAGSRAQPAVQPRRT